MWGARLSWWRSEIASTSKKNNLGALLWILRLVGPSVRPHHGPIAGDTVTLLLNVVFRAMESWPIKIVIDSVAEAALHRGKGP